MILEEATFKKFGYFPDDLKRFSNKKVLVICNECNNEFEVNFSEVSRGWGKFCSTICKSNAQKGKHHSEKTKQKIRKASIGRHPTEETRQKLRKANKGEANSNFGKSPNKKTRQKLSDAGKRRFLKESEREKLRIARKARKGFPQHHTKPELIFEGICKKYNLPFKYTGDGAFWIGKNPTINPDFVNCNGKKIAVEIFGDYWHSPLLKQNISYSQSYEGRNKILKEYGWKLMVFWGTDLLREDAEQFILNKLKGV